MRIFKDQNGDSWVCCIQTQLYTSIARMFGQTDFPVIKIRKLGK